MKPSDWIRKGSWMDTLAECGVITICHEACVESSIETNYSPRPFTEIPLVFFSKSWKPPLLASDFVITGVVLLKFFSTCFRFRSVLFSSFKACNKCFLCQRVKLSAATSSAWTNFKAFWLSRPQFITASNCSLILVGHGMECRLQYLIAINKNGVLVVKFLESCIFRKTS